MPVRVQAPAEGLQAAEPPRRWCRVQLVVSLVRPSPGRLIDVTRGPRTLRVTLCAPAPVLAALVLAWLGQHPWTAALLRYVRIAMGW